MRIQGESEQQVIGDPVEGMIMELEDELFLAFGATDWMTAYIDSLNEIEGTQTWYLQPPSVTLFQKDPDEALVQTFDSTDIITEGISGKVLMRCELKEFGRITKLYVETVLDPSSQNKVNEFCAENHKESLPTPIALWFGTRSCPHNLGDCCV